MKRYLALSRTTHAVLDIAAPGYTALLWLGGLPALGTILLALFTAFAAYTSVYALNDLVGLQFDREKFAGSGINPGYSVEASAQRYPLAQNVLDIRGAAWWIGIWFALALIGSYLLNPVIVLILIAGAALEVWYARLLKVTFWRTLVSGLVKTSGPIAGILVVDRAPDLLPLLLVFAWLFFWEIGGQNIPADWNDTEEDRRVKARTIPLQLGFKAAGRVVFVALSITVLLSAFLHAVSPADLGWGYGLAVVLMGLFLLLRPAYALMQSHAGRAAARLFDRASYYPLAMLVLLCVFLAPRLLAP